MKAELVKKLKEIPDIMYRDPAGKPIPLAHSISDYYIDIKRAYGYPEVLDLISHYLYTHIPGGTTCIAAKGYGSIAPAAVIETEYKLKLAMIREEEKKHGKGGMIDGHIPTNEDRITVIDDVFTTGGSIRKVAEVLKPTGAQILMAVVVVKRGEGNLDDIGISVKYLLVPEDLL